jgi:hypothetical protein
MSYQSYYNIGLLDDLHNYFPDILYGSRGRFRNVDELLEYIRIQTRNRFDLFSNARDNRQRNRTPLSNSHSHSHSHSLSNNETEILNQIRITLNTEDQVNINQQPNINEINDLITPLTSLVNLLYPQPITQNINNFENLQPVVVYPTQEQITNATSIIELPNNTEICIICQYPMTDSQQIRRISYCRHSFHDSCINTYFTTNVRCPICRHDIRSL